jgi:hypothetical protein
MILFFIHFFTCAYIVWVISPPPYPSPLPINDNSEKSIDQRKIRRKSENVSKKENISKCMGCT